MNIGEGEIDIKNEVIISTPEHVRLPFETAGISTRALAKGIDLLFLSVLVLPIGFVTYQVLGLLSLSNSEISSIILGIFWVFIAFVPVLYFTVTEYWFKGQTLGKRLFRLRVISDDGRNPSFSAIFLRNILQLIDLLPGFYFIGMVAIFIHHQEKRIGDMVAGTLVIKEKQGKEESIPIYHTYLSLTKQDQETFGQLMLISNDFYSIIESYLARREDLHPQRRINLAKQLIQNGWPNIQVFEGKEELFLEKIYLYLRKVHYSAEQPPLILEYYLK